MEPEYEKKYYEELKGYWWFVGRDDLIEKLIRKFSKIGNTNRFLHVGCGDTALMQRLSGFGANYGFDASIYAVKHGKPGTVFNANVVRIPLKNRVFDGVLCLEVLEHLDEPGRALSEIKRVIKDDGRLFISVPAFRLLWSRHDEINQHKTRFNKRQLVQLLEESGFRPLRVTYWNFFLFPPTLMMKIVKRFAKSGGDDLIKVPKFLNSLFSILLLIENSLIMKNYSLPFGVSIVGVFEKSRK